MCCTKAIILSNEKVMSGFSGFSVYGFYGLPNSLRGYVRDYERLD